MYKLVHKIDGCGLSILKYAKSHQVELLLRKVENVKYILTTPRRYRSVFID